LQPVGELEQILVEKIATLAWRYRRLIGTEVKNSTNIDFFDPEKARWNSDHLLRYEASIERAFDRALTQLERKQRMRLGQPILPPIKLDLVQHKIRPGAIIILLLIGRCGKSQNYKMNLANLLSRRNLVILAIGKSTRFGKSMG
jgi:hypothetical protein